MSLFLLASALFETSTAFPRVMPSYDDSFDRTDFGHNVNGFDWREMYQPMEKRRVWRPFFDLTNLKVPSVYLAKTPDAYRLVNRSGGGFDQPYMYM